MKVNNSVDFGSASHKLRAALMVHGNSAAKKMERDAKANAPWENRTTNARNSIQSECGMRGNKIRIAISGNTDYFVYLELANEKKHAILSPTVMSWAGEVYNSYRKVVAK